MTLSHSFLSFDEVFSLLQTSFSSSFTDGEKMKDDDDNDQGLESQEGKRMEEEEEGGEEDEPIFPKENQYIKGKSLRSASEVMGRVRWNFKQHKKNFEVAYVDRFKGQIWVPFTKFDSGNIPEHRIEAFSYRGDIIWSKSSHIDRIFQYDL